MRKLIYYVACTVDGFIARPDGAFDWALAEGEHLADLADEFPETLPAHFWSASGREPPPNRVFDAVLMGRKTHAVGMQFGIASPYPTLRQYVVSRTLTAPPAPDVELIAGDPLAHVRELKTQPGRAIWLCGGGALAAALAPEIDELILKINPAAIGAGIPLFAGPIPTLRLALAHSKVYPSGFVRQRFRVSR